MIIVRFTVGGIAYVSALYAMDNQIGLLNQFLIPDWFSIVITLLLLDLAIYGQHRHLIVGNGYGVFIRFTIQI